MQNYKQFDRLLTRARERGDIDWERIEDRARTTIGGDFGYSSPEDFINSQIYWFKNSWDSYTRRVWDEQPYYVEVWVEKDALATLFSEVADEFRVVTFPSRGYSSFTKIMEALTDSRRFPRYIRMGKPIIILHFADLDPSGFNMTEDIRKRLFDKGYIVKALRRCFSNKELDEIKEAYKRSGMEKRSMVTVQRCALTIEQVRKYNLPPNPTKKADSRARRYISMFGDQCWELDALEPTELQRIIRESIQTWIDADKWNATIQKIEKEKEELKSKFEKVKISFEQ